MQVLIAVLDDLFQFALRSLFGVVTVTGSTRIVDTLPKPLQPLLPLLPAGTTYREPKYELASAQGSYFVAVAATNVRTDPVAAFDNVILSLPYATHVKLLKFGGRWAMVQAGQVSGWVLKDDLTSSAQEVFPRFQLGQAYDAEHDTTARVRLVIDDMFSCQAAALPLTDAEYVTYRLLRSFRKINWPTSRPRLAGRWQNLLRGRSGIHLSVTPKTDTIMEVIDDEQGSLLYVEAVFPDNSIQVSAVGYNGLGVYSEDILPKEVWLELHPIFIEVQ